MFTGFSVRFAFFIIVLACFVPVRPVLAEQPVITIHPDGSISVDGKQAVSKPEQPATPAPPAEEIQIPVPQRTAEPVVPVVPVAVEPPEPALVPQQADGMVAAPPPKPASKPQPRKIRQQAKNEDRVPVPAPAAAPPRPVADTIVESGEKGYTTEAAPESVAGELTGADAIRIALGVAPPARNVNAFPADYEGRKVFQVVFRTEDGEHHVLVDRQSGEIVKPEKKKKKKGKK